MAKVLLAEDDESMLHLLKILLTMEGHEVSVLDLHTDPVAAVRAASPDVMIMDVHLAGKSGMEVLQELRSHDDLRDTAIIMSSGMDLEHETHEAGGTAFLLKPYMPEDLIRLIHQYAPEA